MPTVPTPYAPARAVTRRTRDWAHGQLTVQDLGAMLGPVTFRLPDGREVSPLHVAPWAEDPQAASMPGILRALRGDFACVPFGADRALDLAGDWSPLSRPAPERPGPPHGLSSNDVWKMQDDGLRLTLEYPEDSPIALVERVILPDPAQPAIDMVLTLHIRRDCCLPIGLHPVFRLPDSGLLIDAGPNGGMTFPGALETGVSRLAPAARFASLAAVPLARGGTADLSRLPLPHSTEELVQLTDAGGRATLTWPGEGFRAHLTWDASHFPDLILWVSNRGRTAFPWNGRHQAVGLEPVCAAFDLGTEISAGPNPLQTAGHPTVRSFRAGEVFTTRHRIAVEAV